MLMGRITDVSALLTYLTAQDGEYTEIFIRSVFMAQAFNAGNVPVKARKGQIGKYKKWGYIFMLPFILVFLVFQAWPVSYTHLDVYKRQARG